MNEMKFFGCFLKINGNNYYIFRQMTALSLMEAKKTHLVFCWMILIFNKKYVGRSHAMDVRIR